MTFFNILYISSFFAFWFIYKDDSISKSNLRASPIAGAPKRAYRAPIKSKIVHPMVGALNTK